MLKKVFNIANIITMIRIFGIAGIFWFTPYTTNKVALWIIFGYTLLCLTDFLDGYLARKFNIVSDLGKILDPFADKILILIFLPLLEMNLVTSLPVFIILAREFAVMALRVYSAKQNIILAAGFSGKLKTLITLPVCGILLARQDVFIVDSLPYILIPIEYLRQFVFHWPQWLIQFLIWLTVGVTVWSFFDYCWAMLWNEMIKPFLKSNRVIRWRLKRLIPNIFTLCNFLCGLISIIYSFSHQLKYACFFVLLGLVFDALDGKAARLLGVTSKRGAYLDSIADLMTFGLAPSFYAFLLLKTASIKYGLFLAFIVAILYLCSVIYRLLGYIKIGHTPFFKGLPSPSAATVVVLLGIIPAFDLIGLNYLIIIIPGLLMISSIPYPHVNVFQKSSNALISFIPKISLICLPITLVSLMWVPLATLFPIYELFFIINLSYVLSPIYLKPGKKT